jgi:hypothetical protein
MTGQSPDPLLGLPLMAYGSFSESWGSNLNNAMITLIAQAVVGLTTISSAGGTYTLSATDYVTNEARKRVIKIVGTQTSNLTMVIPPKQAWYWAVNSGTSGGYTATIGVTGGLQVTLPYGRTTPVFTDGTDTWSMLPRLDQMPVPTAYLDMNGYPVSNLPSPTAATHATTKAYVDALIASPSLDTITPPTTAYSFGGQRLINLGVAVNPNDAVNLQNLNGAIAAASISGATTTAAAGTFLAGPSSGAATGTPAFRRIEPSDLPDGGNTVLQGQIFGSG